MALLKGFSAQDYAFGRGDVFVEGWVHIQGSKGDVKYEVIGTVNAKTREVRLAGKPRWTSSVRRRDG